MLKRQRKRIITLAVAALSFAALVLPVPAFATGDHYGGKKCDQESLQVKLAPEDTQTYKMVGWLCWEGRLSGKTVQALVSGFTYDHHYWDFPFQSSKYS